MLFQFLVLKQYNTTNENLCYLYFELEGITLEMQVGIFVARGFIPVRLRSSRRSVSAVHLMDRGV